MKLREIRLDIQYTFYVDLDKKFDPDRELTPMDIAAMSNLNGHEVVARNIPGVVLETDGRAEWDQDPVGSTSIAGIQINKMKEVPEKLALVLMKETDDKS